MGQRLTKARAIGDSEGNFRERLQFLESVTARHLDATLGTWHKRMDNGCFVLEVHKRTYIQTNNELESVKDALVGIVSSSNLHTVSLSLQDAVHEADRLIWKGKTIIELHRKLTAWESNTLLGLHFYFWQYRFSSITAMTGIKSISCFLVVKCTEQWMSVNPDKVIGQTNVRAAEFIAASLKAMGVRCPKWLLHSLKQTAPRKGTQDHKQKKRTKHKQKKKRK